MPRRTFPIEDIFSLPSGIGCDRFSLLVTFDHGRIHAQLLNRRLTKADVAQLLKTTEDGVAYLAKKGCLKPLGRPDRTKQKLFSALELLSLMQDQRWLSKATDLLYEFVEQKNIRQIQRRKRDDASMSSLDTQ